MPIPWTKQSLIDRIRKISRAGGELTYSGLCAARMSGVYAAGRKLFGSWPAAIAAAGLPAELGTRRFGEAAYTKQDVLALIRERDGNGLSVAHSSVLRENRALLNAGIRRFGSWPNAVHRAGVDYDEHYVGWDRDSTRGGAFERVVGATLEAAGIRFRRQKSFKTTGKDKKLLRPDFVMADGAWWDAKLNAWAPHVDESIRKYSPIAPRLVIVFCEGDQRKHRSARFISIDKLIERHEGRIAAARLRKIRRRLEAIRSGKLTKTTLEKWATYWTRERIIADIRKIYVRGGSLVASEVRKRHRRLFGATMQRRVFPGWYAAVAAAGFDSDALRRKGRESRRRKRTRFTPDVCIRELRRRARQGADVTAQGVKDDNEPLAQALFRLWGAHAAALKAAGLDPDKHRRQTHWSKARIRDELRKLARAKSPLTASQISAHSENLYQAIKRHYGGVEHACRAARVPFMVGRYKHAWLNTKGDLIPGALRSAILQWKRAGTSIPPELYRAARRHFGGWDVALEALRIKPDR